MTALQKSKRTYLITGAANRIGRALAQYLAHQAAAVVIHYRSSQSSAEELAKEIRDNGTTAFTIAANLESPDEAQNLLKRVWDIAGPIDVLINNASIFETGRLTEISMDDVQRNMMINAFAPFLLSRSFARLNKDRASAALPVIINFLDSRITGYDRQHVAYHLAKRTLFALTKMMALEFAPNVRVNAVAPGLILPPAGKDRAYLEQLKSANPLNSIGNADQITAAVRFLIDNEFVTGQVIYVDGGRHLIGNTYG
ncbi:MAG: SDR family oxidoreductase [Patescibacteria group bacterium]|nr:SDR family oxidoreductase [Patescibacteria group bacterium]